MVPPKPEPKEKSLLKKVLSFRPYQLTKPYIKNNYVYLTFLSSFIFINFALFVSRAYQYRHQNGYVILARASGKSKKLNIKNKQKTKNEQTKKNKKLNLIIFNEKNHFSIPSGQCLNFDCTFILILMLRQCITFLRTHGFNSILPLDHHIYLHKLTGVLIGIFSAVHTLMHLLNFGGFETRYPGRQQIFIFFSSTTRLDVCSCFGFLNDGEKPVLKLGRLFFRRHDRDQWRAPEQRELHNVWVAAH